MTQTDRSAVIWKVTSFPDKGKKAPFYSTSWVPWPYKDLQFLSWSDPWPSPSPIPGKMESDRREVLGNAVDQPQWPAQLPCRDPAFITGWLGWCLDPRTLSWTNKAHVPKWNNPTVQMLAGKWMGCKRKHESYSYSCSLQCIFKKELKLIVSMISKVSEHVTE